MPRLARAAACCCCHFHCNSDAFFEESNVPAIITTKYEDQCGCRPCCSYPNNVWTILFAQLLTVVAFGFTAAAALDCQFVTVSSALIDAFTTQVFNETQPEGGWVNNNDTKRGLGFFGWETLDGSCAVGGESSTFHEDDESQAYVDSTEGALELYYSNLVGWDWKKPAVMAATSGILAFIAVLWIVLFTCVANQRPYRAALSFLLMVMLPLFQSLTFLVLRTDFCETNDCQLGRSGHQAIAAVLLYFCTGILLCVGTSNFPGNPYTKGGGRQRCSNLLCCRNTCRQFVMDETPEPEYGSEMVEQQHHVDVVEVPVESEFFDTSLIDNSAAPAATSQPLEISVASLRTTPAMDAPLTVSTKTV